MESSSSEGADDKHVAVAVVGEETEVEVRKEGITKAWQYLEATNKRHTKDSKYLFVVAILSLV